MRIRKYEKYIFIFSVILILFLTNSIISYANNDEIISKAEGESNYMVGDIIGTFKKSDTKMLVSVSCNQYNFYTGYKFIPTYSVNNELCIIVEDLVYYGYTSLWDPEKRTTRLYINDGKKNTEGTKKIIKQQGNIYYTDIKIYVDGYEMQAYNINGYSLVKLSDLSNTILNLRFKKMLKYDVNMVISGKIELPNEDVAPEGGMEVAPVFYFFNAGRLDKYYGNKFLIPEGKSMVDYKIELPIHEYWNKMGYDNPNVYNYIGYEVDNADENYITYDMQGSTNTKPMYLEQLNYYHDNYDNVNITVLPKQSMKMNLELTGDVFELYGEEYSRAIRMNVFDVASGQTIMKEKRINCSQQNVEFEFELVKNRDYRFYYNIMVIGSFPGRMPLPPAPQYPTFYCRNGNGEIDEKLVEIVKANEENSNINVSIKLPDIIIGDACKADKKIIYNSSEINSCIVNGRYLLSLKDVPSDGRSASSVLKYDCFNSRENLSTNVTEKSMGKLIFSNYWARKGDNKIPIYWLNNGNALDEYEFVLIDDLKEFGFDVIYNEYFIEIVFSGDSN